MRYYLDTEFIERGYQFPVELISIGVVAENGDEFYAVCADGWNETHASDWVVANVLPNLSAAPRTSRTNIAASLRSFITADRGPAEIYGYYAAYDWVLFCQLFGTMMDLPPHFPRFIRDVKQIAARMWDPMLPAQIGTAHNALDDARHIREMHEFLLRLGARR